MKKIVAFSLILGLSTFGAFTTSNTMGSEPKRDQNCPPSDTCGLAVSWKPRADADPTPTIVPALGGRYYYVSPRGNDSNPGTQSAPFQTIGMAAQAANAGDVVLIQAGVYYEDVKPMHSGEPDRYITFLPAGDGEVIIDAQSGRRGGCIEIANKAYLQFIGLIVRGANSYETWPRAGISMTDGTSHILLDNMTAYNNFVGIMAYGREKPVSFVTIRNSKTFGPGNRGNAHYGIFFYQQVYDSWIVDNHIAFALDEEQSYGIEVSTNYPGTPAYGSRRIVISGNEIDHNESQGIQTWNAASVLIRGNFLHDNGATGIQVEDGSENIVVEENLSENNTQKYEFEAGVWIDNSKNVAVRNNILRNNKVGLIITGSDQVTVHDNYLYLNNRGAENLYNAAGLIVKKSPKRIYVTHNTFYNNGAGGIDRGGVNFGNPSQACLDIIFKNNIIADSASFFELVQDSCSGFVSDFNDFINARPLAIQWNQRKVDWPTYLAESAQDAHSLTSNPLFENPNAFNFSLQSASPLKGKGTMLAKTISEGAGRLVPITDAKYFTDGFGIASGDWISIDGNRVRIQTIDYDNNMLEVDQTIRWGKNAPVSFPFAGSAPDLGANGRP
jgi:parallel beta-helix repeat protein